ncbi:MAG: hypothetical protein JWQ40_1940 [Segetibacter sp.]|nr:hypothetical protein [Segetibacter sp.]
MRQKAFLCFMNASRYMATVFAAILFAACVKEYSFERGPAGSVAKGSLRATSGDCQPATINGVYKQDGTVGDSNYVIVQVRFTSPGRYKIFTDTQNGFSFYDSSVVADTGYQSIKLKATGKPILAQVTNFLVAFDTSFCRFSVPVVGTAATYTLAGSPNSCSNSNVQGIYTVGTALSAFNTVTLRANVATIGSYSITTTTTNGITFQGSGNFTSTGLQTVALQGIGMPTTPGKNMIPVASGTSDCGFIVNVMAGGGVINRADSAWQFRQGNNYFHGYFDGALTDNSSSGSTILTLVGLTPTKDTAIAILVNMEGSSTVKPGTYKSSTSSTFVFFNYTGNTIYTADKTTRGVELTVVITAYDAATQIAEGTFSGTVLNQANQQVPIAQGKFKAQITQ